MLYLLCCIIATMYLSLVFLFRQCTVFITLYYYCDIVFIVLLYLLQAMMIGGFTGPPYIPYIITAIGAASYYIDIN